MNRAPLVNIPKPKKEPKPLKRYKPLNDPAKLMPFTPRLPGSRKAIKREGKRGAAKRKARKVAVDLYFQKFGHITDEGWTAPCQMSGREMRREDADACHKIRASQQGGEQSENIVAALRICHQWQHLHRQAENEMVASEVNCETGGLIQWSPAIQGNLDAHLKRNGL